MPIILPLNYPDTDGARYSRTSIDLSMIATRTVANQTTQIAPALRIEGWVSWKYKRSLKPGKGWGHRAKPQVRTTGKFDPSGELTVYHEDSIQIENYLAAAGAAFGLGPFQQSFQLTAVLFETALGDTRWDMLGCRISEDGSGPDKESDDALEVPYTLDVMDILRDGQSAVYENTPFGQVGVLVTFT